MSSQTLSLTDGRQIGYTIEGKGKPIIYFHGTASSRLEILLLKEFAHMNKFRLIGIDRPGYGLSTFTKRFNLKDFTADVNALAEHLQISQFTVLSWSGGGPFALAYTAIFPEKVTHAVVVGSPALPFDVATAHNNNPLAKIAMKNQFLATWALKAFKKSVLKANQDTDAYLRSRSGKNMLADWPEPDARFFSNPAWLKLMYTSMAEAFRQGDDGVKAVFQEHNLFMHSWSAPITQIPPGKLLIWHGSQDKTCPTENAYKIAHCIKGAHLEVFPEEGHCVMFSKLEKLCKALNQET